MRSKDELCALRIETYISVMKVYSILLVGLLTACGPNPPKQSFSEIVGPLADRVANVGRIISKHGPLPSPLLDARFVEEQIGDGDLGPSDFTSFYELTVAPTDIAKWRAVLKTTKDHEYDSPNPPKEWWVSEADFARLDFFEPKPLTGRIHGWVGIAGQTGKIYILAFTM